MLLDPNIDAGTTAAIVSTKGERPGNRYAEERNRAAIARGLHHELPAKVPVTPGGKGDAGRAHIMNAAYGGQHSMEPLKVIHMTPAGQQLGVEYLPFTSNPQPVPVNI